MQESASIGGDESTEAGAIDLEEEDGEEEKEEEQEINWYLHTE